MEAKTQFGAKHFKVRFPRIMKIAVTKFNVKYSVCIALPNAWSLF